MFIKTGVLALVLIKDSKSETYSTKYRGYYIETVLRMKTGGGEKCVIKI